MGAAGIVFRTVLLFSAIQALPPQTPPPPTGLILGRVVDAASGRPVASAIVALDGAGMGAPGGPASSPRALTNANGQFVFRKLPKGTFALTASKAGYVEGAYGRRRPGGSQASVELTEGQRAGDIVIPVWRFAAVSGTVTDEAGEPLVGVEMRLYERRYLAGRRRLVSGGAYQSTDDRGVYRFGSVTPGDYVVAFVWREVTMPATTAEILRTPSNDPKFLEISRERMPLGGGLMPSGGVQIGDLVRQLSPSAPVPPQGAGANAAIYTYPTQYFPGTPSLAQAATLALKSGEERGGVDFSLRPAKAGRVSGTVIGPDGPAANVALRLVPEGDDFATEIETSAAMSGPAGNFTFLGVIPGSYVIKVIRVPRPPASAAPAVTTIQMGGRTIMSTSGPPGARPGIPSEPTLWASVPVAVAEADVTGVTVALQSGARLTGRLEFDGSRERPDAQQLTRVPIMIERSDRSVIGGLTGGFPATGRVEESGTFATYGVPGGKYLVRVGGAPPGWTLRSVMSAGQDISDTPLDIGAADVKDIVITFTDRPTKLTGVVRGDNGNPDPDAMVVVFPTDSAGWSDYGLNPRRLRSIHVAKTGTFTVSGLPAGEYFVAAVKDENLSSGQHPELLEALSRIGTRVPLSEGDTKTLDLKIGVPR